MEALSVRNLIRICVLWAMMLPMVALHAQTNSSPRNEDGTLFQLALGAGPYSDSYNNSYGFGLSNYSRQSGAAGLLGLGGSSAYGRGTAYGGVGLGVEVGGGQAGFAGAAALATATAVPNMIGDTSAGGCGGFILDGQLVATIAHPTFACSRLNIAENNSAQVQNRLYYSYRHFNSASTYDWFSYMPPGRGVKKMLDIDRHTIGLERKIGPKASLELRVPILYQGTPDMYFAETDPSKGYPFPDANTILDRDVQMGNISVIFKRQLYESRKWIWSAGLGVNIPTSPDIDVDVFIDVDNFQMIYPDGSLGGVDDLYVDVRGRYANRTVNIQPFLAYRWTPNRRLFGHGFLQIDIPANGSSGHIDPSIVVSGPDTTNLPPFNAKVYLQSVMRLNVGGGYWIYRNEQAPLLNGIAGMLEFHWTSTLNDASLLGLNGEYSFVVDGQDANLILGNMRNRVDIVNCVVGVPVQLGKTMVTNSLTFPVSTSRDKRGFSCEYMCAIERRF